MFIQENKIYIEIGTLIIGFIGTVFVIYKYLRKQEKEKSKKIIKIENDIITLNNEIISKQVIEKRLTTLEEQINNTKVILHNILNNDITDIKNLIKDERIIEKIGILEEKIKNMQDNVCKIDIINNNYNKIDKDVTVISKDVNLIRNDVNKHQGFIDSLLIVNPNIKKRKAEVNQS
jgi:hypothetical protein